MSQNKSMARNPPKKEKTGVVKRSRFKDMEREKFESARKKALCRKCLPFTPILFKQ